MAELLLVGWIAVYLVSGWFLCWWILGIICVRWWWQRRGDGGLTDGMGFTNHGGGLMVVSWMTWVVWWAPCVAWWGGFDDCCSFFFLGYDFGFTGYASIAPTRQNFALIWLNLLWSNWTLQWSGGLWN